jgi:valyl-tRNA synthetase
MSSDKYIHLDVEDKIYSYWEKNELFKPRSNSKKYSVVIPPPNVTGSLHMGHALNNSIQDFLVRYYRMNSYETLWQPGTDHAGIATQALVERKLEKEGSIKLILVEKNLSKRFGSGKTNMVILLLISLKN